MGLKNDRGNGLKEKKKNLIKTSKGASDRKDFRFNREKKQNKTKQNCNLILFVPEEKVFFFFFFSFFFFFGDLVNLFFLTPRNKL